MSKSVDLSKIRNLSDLNAESVANICRVHFKTRELAVSGFDDGCFESLLSGGVNDNYNSELKKLPPFKVEIPEDDSDADDDAETSSAKKETSLNWVVKKDNEAPLYKTMSKLNQVNVGEVFWYSEARPVLALKYDEIAKMTPVCYYGYSSARDDIVDGPEGGSCCQRFCCFLCWCPCKPPEKTLLIIENVTVGEKGGESFKMVDKTKVDYEHVSIALETLADFHGINWRLLNDRTDEKELDNLRINVLKLYGRSPPAVMKTMIGSMWNSSMKSLLALLKNRGLDQELINRVKRYAESKCKKEFQNLICHEADKIGNDSLTTLIHGDFWSNNMMFRYEDSKPVQVKVLDYQMMMIKKPFQDIFYFLYVNTDRSFRKTYLDLVLQKYFDKLRSWVNKSPKLDLDYRSFVDEFNQHRRLGFISGLIVMPNVLSPNQRKLQKLSDGKKMDIDRHRDIAGVDADDDHPMIREIRKRLVDMVEELAELGEF